ncbi:MAG TPA: ribonuclease HI family protein [Candidatus Dormibacteraeota bacterium]|jgi:ribonuclease HI|nr:ribonuclease HI family protein [Candidatus Dormibacteraeota bacterium]
MTATRSAGGGTGDGPLLRLFTDGAARGNPGPAGAGLVIEDASGRRLWGGCRYLGVATNNQAEYRALIAGLRKVAEWAPRRLEVYLDSELVVRQLDGRYRVKSADLRPLHVQATALLRAFPEVTVTHVPRERNRGADALANRAIDEHVPSPDALEGATSDDGVRGEASG